MNGLSMVIFDSEENARAAADRVSAIAPDERERAALYLPVVAGSRTWGVPWLSLDREDRGAALGSRLRRLRFGSGHSRSRIPAAFLDFRLTQ